MPFDKNSSIGVFGNASLDLIIGGVNDIDETVEPATQQILAGGVVFDASAVLFVQIQSLYDFLLF